MMLDAAHVEAMKRPLAEAACLPGYTYRDAEFEQVEFERIFGRRWFSIGMGGQIPRKGDVKPVQVGGTPLLLVRDLQGEVRVFHNVCRHRGLRLFEVPQNRPHGSMTCPYHGWTYKLDGRCAAIPYWNRDTGERRVPELDAGYGLVQVRSTMWLDMIFVDLSGVAAPFEQFIAPLESRLPSSRITDLYCLSRWDVVAPGNWKLVIENYMDPYHLSFVHPQVGSIKSAAEHDNLSLCDDIWGVSYRQATEKRAWSDPLPEIAELGDLLGKNSQSFMIFPNTLIFMQPTFMALRTILPLTVDTAYEAELIYISNGATSDDWIKQRQQIVESAQIINDQDLPVIARLQSTRSSVVADQCRFVPDWDVRSQRFQTRIADVVVNG